MAIWAICLFVGTMMLPGVESSSHAATPSDKSTATTDTTAKMPADQTAGTRDGGDASLRAGESHRRRNTTAPPELQESDMSDALEVLHDFNPELAQKLGDWLKEHPQNARVQLSRRVPWIVRLVHLRRDDPAGYELAIADLQDYARTNALASQLRQAQNASEKDQARIDALTASLKKLLAEHFDLREKIRARDIQKLQDRLTQLRKQMDERLSSRDRILEARFKQLTQPKKPRPRSKGDGSDQKSDAATSQ